MPDKHSILCVDDELNILKLLKRLLEGHGYEVVTASSGDEALQILEKQRVDVIVSDQRMPGMTGSDLFRITREKYPQAVRVMMSGYSDFDSLVNAVNEGEIFRFISKPWDQKQFVELVRLALAQQDVAASVEDVIKNVCKVAKLVNRVSVEAPSDSQSLTIKIGENEEVFNKDTVLHFLKTLFDALGLDEAAASFAGAVSKRERHGLHHRRYRQRRDAQDTTAAHEIEPRPECECENTSSITAAFARGKKKMTWKRTLFGTITTIHFTCVGILSTVAGFGSGLFCGIRGLLGAVYMIIIAPIALFIIPSAVFPSRGVMQSGWRSISWLLVTIMALFLNSCLWGGIILGTIKAIRKTHHPMILVRIAWYLSGLCTFWATLLHILLVSPKAHSSRSVVLIFILLPLTLALVSGITAVLLQRFYKKKPNARIFQSKVRAGICIIVAVIMTLLFSFGALCFLGILCKLLHGGTVHF